MVRCVQFAQASASVDGMENGQGLQRQRISPAKGEPVIKVEVIRFDVVDKIWAFDLSNKATYDTKTIHTIINSTQVLHVSFGTNDHPSNPVVLPMIGQLGSFAHPSASISDPLDLYLHGYVSSRIMNLSRDPTNPLRICVCATKVDGLVLTLTPNSHNYSYRSAVVHGVAELVMDREEKLWAMELITNSVVPGRWSETRVPPDEAEMQSTQILKVVIESASGKVREGVPNDEPKDLENEDVLNRVWTGVIPVYETLGIPVPGPYNRIKEIPSHVADYVEERSRTEKEYAVKAAYKPAPVKLEKKDGESDD